MRVGGTQAPNANAILDLNKSEGSKGSKGLLLPRVELVETTNPSPIPFTLNTRGMYVYNIASAGDVTPGVYYNDGSKWVKVAASGSSAVKQLEVTLGYDITVGNIAYLGVTSAATTAPTVVSVTPIISGDDTMLAAQLNTGVTANVVGNTVKWSLKVNNNNIDNTKRCRIEKVIISYISDDTLTSSTINSYVHTGW
ncbi:hypothetical protein FACS18945_5230 [Bacteroidia bacterium]|nr:hypothetical protein FACS18945_5230 [Bacteroidia bacterium]